MTADMLTDRIARAICAEKCAFRGDPPCYTVFSDERPTCGEPSCMDLARAAVASFRSDNEISYMRWKRGERIEVLAKERKITRERMRTVLEKLDRQINALPEGMRHDH